MPLKISVALGVLSAHGESRATVTVHVTHHWLEPENDNFIKIKMCRMARLIVKKYY